MPKMSPTNLPFTEAIDYFRQKVNLPTYAWNDIMNQAHDRSFVVAGAYRDDLLTDFRTAIDKAIANGTTLEEFRDDFDNIVKKHGWSYNGGRNWRTRVIYQTNLRSAYAAGRLKQMQDPDVIKMRPYWQYKHGDSRVARPEHLGWDGLILRHDDPFWQTHMPPNGWNCSCYTIAIGDYHLEQMGRTSPDKAPQITTRPILDTATNKMVDVPMGIDLGWAYQVGKTWVNSSIPKQLLKPLSSVVISKAARKGEIDLPPLKDISKPLKKPLLADDLTESEYVNSFLAEFDASVDNPILFRDVTGQAVIISDELFKNNKGIYKVKKRGRELYLLRLAETIKDPDEIWVEWDDHPTKGVILARKYLRYDKDKNLLSVFSWSKYGWLGTTSFDPTVKALEIRRSGALLYRRDK